MLNIDKNLRAAYELKELYMIFNRLDGDRETISMQLDELITEYKLSDIESFVKIGNTFDNWRKEIIDSFHTYNGRRINNGPIEGRNKYIKIILELANGYRNFKRYRNRAMYVLNRYEQPLDEPQETKTIKLPGEIRGKYKKTRK